MRLAISTLHRPLAQADDDKAATQLRASITTQTSSTCVLPGTSSTHSSRYNTVHKVPSAPMEWQLVPVYAIKAVVFAFFYILGILWSLVAASIKALAVVFHPVIGIANLMLNAASSVFGIIASFKVQQTTLGHKSDTVADSGYSEPKPATLHICWSNDLRPPALAAYYPTDCKHTVLLCSILRHRVRDCPPGGLVGHQLSSGPRHRGRQR